MKSHMKMPRALLALLLCTAVLLPGCMKNSTKITIANDATGTIEIQQGLNTASFEAIAEYLAQMLEMAGEMGEEMGDEDPLEKLEEIEQGLTKEKISKELSKYGVEIVSSKQVEENDWRLITANGKIKDVNAWSKAVAKARKQSDTEERGLGSLGRQMMAPRFYLTEKAGVGEVVMMDPMNMKDVMDGAGPGGMDPTEIPEGMEEMVEAQLDMMKQQFGINEFKLQLELTLPGKIVSAKGLTIDPKNDKRVTFSMNGSDMSVKGMKTMFGMKDGLSARFEIPKDCKLTFEKKPVKTTAPKTAEKKPEDKAEEKKKGGLGIEEDGK